MSRSSSAVRMMLRPMRPKPLIPTLMGITSSDEVSEIAALQERLTAAGEQKMLWVAQTKVNARAENLARYNSADERLVTCVHPASAVRFGTRCLRPPASPLDFLTGSGAHLLLRIFLPRLSCPRVVWAARDSPRRGIHASFGGSVRAGMPVVTAHG